jgi:large subunit ribosomal protein L10
LAISKEKKQESVAELKEMLGRSKAIVLSDYRGLTATQMAALRNKLRPLDSQLVVAKNTLLLRSLKEVGMPAPEDLFTGPTLVGFCFGDFREPARMLLNATRETEFLKVKGGLLGNTVLHAGQVQMLTTLPSVETLHAMALGGISSPLNGFVGVLDSALRGLLYAFDAHIEQLEKAAA